MARAGLVRAVSLPNPIRQDGSLQMQAAPWAAISFVPALDTVPGGDRALGLEVDPLEALLRGLRQSGKDRLKCWGWAGRVRDAPLPGTAESHSLMLESQPRWLRHPDPRHRVVEFLAVATQDGLDEEIKPAVGPTGNFRPVTAARTLEAIRPPHAVSRQLPWATTTIE